MYIRACNRCESKPVCNQSLPTVSSLVQNEESFDVFVSLFFLCPLLDTTQPARLPPARARVTFTSLRVEQHVDGLIAAC
jgi:hypothetical protein